MGKMCGRLNLRSFRTRLVSERRRRAPRMEAGVDDQHLADFAEVVAAVSPSLRRLALALTGDAHRSEDAVQSTLERLFLAWPRLTIRDPAAYARAALVRQVATERRRAWWRREMSVEVLPELTPRDADHDDRLVLLDHLAALPQRQRHTVVLRYLEDLSVEETAQRMGTSSGAVRNRALRALERVRPLLDDSLVVHPSKGTTHE